MAHGWDPGETRMLPGCALEKDLAMPEGLCCAQEDKTSRSPGVSIGHEEFGAKLKMLVPITAR